MTFPTPSTKSKYWSEQVTRESNALDFEPGLSTWDDPARIALSLKDSARRRRILNQAKRGLGRAFGK